jgi:hypothetical protein
MGKKTKKINPRYAVNISMKAWDLAKAGAAVRLKISDRDGLLATVEIGQGTFGWKGPHGRRFQRYSWRQIAAKLDQS